MIDKTHDPGLRSWVDSANRPGCDFPIQNLPVGVFQEGRAGSVSDRRFLVLRSLTLPARQRKKTAY